MSHAVSNSLAGGNGALSPAGFAAGTTTTYTIGTAFDYVIQGRIYNKTTATNAATPTTDANTKKAFVPVTPSKGCVYLFCVDTAGTVTVYQGPLNSAGQPTDSPALPADVALFGLLQVKAASNAAAGGFILGVNNLSGVTGITYAFQNRMARPPVPIAG